MKKTAAILAMKCPRCYEGNLFTYSHPHSLRQLHLMPEHCEKCGLKFTPEPGFYTGAMYISYGFTVLLFVLYFFVLNIGLHIEGFVFLATYASSLLVLFPYLFRYSRTVFLHLFYEYKPEAKEAYLNHVHLK
ncbi:MAG TPA: DUF983 domain-containing protein [Cytophagaceae bacterium]|jgi:uncharacterized protein (DUF983 family)|nr:DUF983 domain-containing protein [Cytophagaceae bacterium]